MDSGLICIPYVSTGGQLVDVLMKGLASGWFQEIIIKLGMDDIYSPTWGGVLKIIIVVMYNCERYTTMYIIL